MQHNFSSKAGGAWGLLFCSLLLAGIFTGCGGGGGGGSSASHAGYTIAVLPPLSNDASLSPAAISSLGHIAGNSYSGQAPPGSARRPKLTNPYYVQAALVESLTSQALGYPNDTSGSLALGINSSDEVVGCSSVGSGSSTVALMWQSGVMTQLTPLSAGSSKALAVNDSGVIVGSSAGQPAEWQSGAPTALSIPNGDTGIATGINASGTIVGTVTGASTNAVEWQGGVMTTLPLPTGATSSSATAINSSGEIVGYATISSITRACMWQNGVVTLLAGNLPGEALAINDSGIIVGFTTSNAASSAALWQNGGQLNLDNDLPTGSGWTLTEATGINNSDDIIGTGNLGGFLMTPGA